MANASSKHLTLVADAVSTVTLDKDYDTVEVVNVDGAAAVYFTVDGAVPTVAGDGTVVVPPTIAGVEVSPYGVPRRNRGADTAATVVKLISHGTPVVSVRGWNVR